jgi:hypothetical protein
MKCRAVTGTETKLAFENGTAESSDKINVSDVPVVFLEDA